FIVELIVIFLPILFHAIYGLIVVYGSGVNTLRYKYYRNWFYVLQRLTGLLTLIFIAYHVFALRFSGLSPVDTVQSLVAFVKTPFGLIFYVVGVLSAIFHFANGLWAFFITWGITIGPRSQKIATYFCSAVFIVLAVVGMTSLAHLVA
ncbi:MAG: succinate dehydrogenase, partial [Peptococcaceae bacterium]|nr:succinate dehydrogenase [Peptococcaceae bacterium]